jgi:hypothetical protein
MEKTEQLIARTEHLLKQIETLQEAIVQLQLELRCHSDDLGQHLHKLRRKPHETHQIRPLTTQERRADPRRKGNPISVHVGNGSSSADPLQGWVVDRSAGGIRLLMDEAMESGTMLSIRPVKVHAGFPWVQVRVKNCYPERKSWSLGCQFVHKITWEDLQHFG